MQIIVTNTQCKLLCKPHHLDIIREKFKIRSPGAFYSDAFRKRQWDGFVRYITGTGMFDGGMLADLVAFIIKEFGKAPKLIDNRDMIYREEIITQVGDLTLRGLQKGSVKALLKNKVLDLPYPRGILKEATNAGKTLIAAAVFLSYPEDTHCVFLIHRKLAFEQLKRELKELIGDKEVGEVSSGIINPKRFTVCMVQSVGNKLSDIKVKRMLAMAKIVIVDECHRAATTEYKKVLLPLYNCPVRVGLSGTPLMHKDKTKNQTTINFFGPILHETSNKTLVDKGFSTKPNITVLLGVTDIKIHNYKEEYDAIMTDNRKFNKRVWRRVAKKLAKGKIPCLVFCKHIKHAKNLLKLAPLEIRENYKIGIIHTGLKSNHSTLEEFRKGKIDILIGTHLLAESHNLPLIKYGVNCGGGSSIMLILQWFGRMLRTHKSKKSVDVEDFYHLGIYQKRHSKRRVRYYKAEQFVVKETYKNQAKKKSIKII